MIKAHSTAFKSWLNAFPLINKLKKDAQHSSVEPVEYTPPLLQGCIRYLHMKTSQPKLGLLFAIDTSGVLA